MKKSVILFRSLCLIGLLVHALRMEAQPTAPVTTLYTSLGDGSAQFAVDPFGAYRGCGGNGIVFNPLGGFGPLQTDCFSTVYLFEPSTSSRVPLADNDWPYYNLCQPGGTEIPLSNTFLTSDVTVGTHTRITQFNLPQFPNLSVQLTQVACGNRLVQTYAFTNTGAATRNLRITRSGDIDVEYTAPFFRNWGGEYPIGSSSPIGATVMDLSTNFGVAFTAPAGYDAVFQGWRIQAQSSGSFGHSETYGSFGYQPINYPGSAGSGLNGIWSNAGGFGTPGAGLCGTTVADLPLAPNFASYQASYGATDMNAIIQSSLLVPPGTTKVYVTETVAYPGQSCCQGPNCGTISGNVKYDLGGCTPGTPLANQVVAAVNGTSMVKYYGITDAAGNYMINLPYGTYSVGLDIISNQSCGPALPSYTVNAINPAIINVNMLLNDICDSDLYIIGGYPSNLPIPNGCGVPPTTPCPGSPYEYCFTILNSGTSTIPAGTPFLYDIPSGFPITNNPSNTCLTVTTSPPGTTTATLNNPLVPNAACQFCVLVNPVPTYTPPVLAYILAGDNFVSATCLNGDILFDAAFQSENQLCSCDPNHKDAQPLGCGPNNVIAPGDLTYTVTFHNIGTGPAKRVVVTDRLDTDLDIGTLRLLNTNYPLTDLRIEPVAGFPGQFELVFIFDNIFLPSILTDPHAEGRIVYRIAPQAGLPDGTRIENEATIFFDDNAPIQTNTVFQTLRAQPKPLLSLPATHSLYLGYGPTCTTLAPTVTGGSPPYTYAWSQGGTGSTANVCPSSTTTYSVTVTDAEGCSAVATTTVEVTDVHCGPQGTKVLLCHNGHEICVSPNAVSAQLANGSSLGPCGSAKTAPAPTAPLAETAFIRIHPNPTQGHSTLRFGLGQPGDATLDLYAMDGRLVSRLWQGQCAQETTLELDFSKLPSGIYAIRLSGNGSQWTQRLVITH